MKKWIFFDEGQEHNPDFEVEAEDFLKAYDKAYDDYGPQVASMYYKEKEEPMNKLEQRIFEAFEEFDPYSQYTSKQDGARIAAKIALELAEEAWYDGGEEALYKERGGLYGGTFEDFKQGLL